MRSSNLSVMGLYEWDNTLFDLMQLPEGLTKDTLVKNLLAETAELEVLYTNPVVMKNLIGVWSNKEIDVWNHLYETTQYEYNPIENYDRYEEGTEDSTGNTTHGGSDGGTNTRTQSGTDSTTVSRAGGGSDTVAGTDQKGHFVAGFDAGTPTTTDDGLFKQTRDEDTASTTTTYGKTETGTDATTYGRSETERETMTYGHEIDTTNSGSHELHVHGNIGVMSSQNMIQQERDIALFNLYDTIIESFKQRFCIMVY